MTIASRAIGARQHPVPIVWRLAADPLLRSGRYVTLHPEHIPSLLPRLASSTDHAYWRDYVGPVDPNAPNLGQLFYELALTVAQFGGFTHVRPDGDVAVWKREGSGVKAVLATMREIRDAKCLPGIDIHDDYSRRLAHFFIDKPFGAERLAIMIEIATNTPPAFFARTLRAIQTPAGLIPFDAAQMRGLACRLPKAFGEDNEFFKKASLLLMTMEIALRQLGHRASSSTIPPADYRIPQILHGLGILRFAPDLEAKLDRGHMFRLTDPEVRAVRAATVAAVGMIRDACEREGCGPVSTAALDGMLYMLSRDQKLMTAPTMKPHMRVATLAF